MSDATVSEETIKELLESKKKLKQQKQDYYQRNKAKYSQRVYCTVCCSTIARSAINAHKKSRKHIANLKLNSNTSETFVVVGSNESNDVIPPPCPLSKESYETLLQEVKGLNENIIQLNKRATSINNILGIKPE